MITTQSSSADLPEDPDFRRDRTYSRLLLPIGLLNLLEIEKTQAEAQTDGTDSAWVAPPGRSEQIEKLTTPGAPVAARVPRRPRGAVKIYEPAVLEELLARVKKGIEGRGERADFLKKTAQALIEKGPYRALVKPSKSWRQDLQRLREIFPNSHRVLDYLESEFLIAAHAGKPPTFSPFWPGR